jgi:ATP-binding cassette subfamily B (MDR/TAP) protein 1
MERQGSIINEDDQVKEIENREENPEQVPITKFFTYINGNDKTLLIIGTVTAILAGGLMPSISLIMGNVAAAFTETDDSSSGTDIVGNMAEIASYVILIACSLFVFSYVFYAFWQHLAENIIEDLRKRYLKSLMRQEIAYFEKNKVEEIPSQMSEIFETLKASIGEQISNLLYAFSTCIAGIVYSLCFGPIFALACIAYLPVLLGILGVFGLMVKKSTLGKLNVIKHLGGIAEETLTAIKVVTSFGREERELKKFANWSRNTQKVAKK